MRATLHAETLARAGAPISPESGAAVHPSQQLFDRTIRWKITDAKRGIIAEGETAVALMRAVTS